MGVSTDQSSTSTAQSTATINNHRRPPGIIGRRTSYANHLPASPATSTSSPHAAFTSIISNLLFFSLFLFRTFLFLCSFVLKKIPLLDGSPPQSFHFLHSFFHFILSFSLSILFWIP